MRSFLVPPYNMRVFVTTCPKAFHQKYTKHQGKGQSIELEQVESFSGMAGVLTLGDKQPGFIIYMAPTADYSTTFHEALHITHFIMEKVDIPISVETTEVQAYMMEYIAKKTWQLL